MEKLFKEINCYWMESVILSEDLSLKKASGNFGATWILMKIAVILRMAGHSKLVLMVAN